jgi:hypothetical protein
MILMTVDVEVGDDAATTWCKSEFDSARLCACGREIGEPPVVARAVAPHPRFFHWACARAHGLDLLEDAAALALVQSPTRAVPLLRAALVAAEYSVS